MAITAIQLYSLIKQMYFLCGGYSIINTIFRSTKKEKYVFTKNKGSEAVYLAIIIIKENIKKYKNNFFAALPPRNTK